MNTCSRTHLYLFVVLTDGVGTESNDVGNELERIRQEAVVVV